MILVRNNSPIKEAKFMPPRKYHLEFDKRLRNNGVIFDTTDGNSVHARLDRNAKKFGRSHRGIDSFHTPWGIRRFIDNIVNSIGNINQSTATDYIRIGYGHLCLDHIVSKLKEEYDCTYEELDWKEVYTRTWRYFKSKGFDKKFYKKGFWIRRK